MKKKYYTIAKLLVIIALIIFVAYIISFNSLDVERATRCSLWYRIYMTIDVEAYLYYLMMLCLPLSIIAVVLFKHAGSDGSRRLLIWQMLSVIEIIVFAMWSILFSILPMIFLE